ncbi:MAG: type II toxin-antitoxin system VapC family toxin [Thermoanaerobaculia bacterium]|nr:type II toxin-antitoxin system VapC family toxin [Thermoanaerobaculia bacterium]
MRKRIYIETTIPSFYYTLRQDVESQARMVWTRQWWADHSGEYGLTSSAAVVAELRRGTSDRAIDRINLLQEVELLTITDEIEEIAKIYVDKMVMPRDPTGDALHLAIASFHRVDFLLTWNCTHLANANKIERIRLLNYDIGLPTPALTTPLNFLSGGD